jgi:hypothetical protein
MSYTWYFLTIPLIMTYTQLWTWFINKKDIKFGISVVLVNNTFINLNIMIYYLHILSESGIQQWIKIQRYMQQWIEKEGRNNLTEKG